MTIAIIIAIKIMIMIMIITITIIIIINGTGWLVEPPKPKKMDTHTHTLSINPPGSLKGFPPQLPLPSPPAASIQSIHKVSPEFPPESQSKPGMKMVYPEPCFKNYEGGPPQLFIARGLSLTNRIIYPNRFRARGSPQLALPLPLPQRPCNQSTRLLFFHPDPHLSSCHHNAQDPTPYVPRGAPHALRRPTRACHLSSRPRRLVASRTRKPSRR